MIVDERVSESKEIVDVLLNSSFKSPYQLAAATERLESAVVWARFFNMDGDEYHIDNVSLKASCEDKITHRR